MIQSLNGLWQVGINRQYDRCAEVPGMVYSAEQVPAGTVWYQRKVQLPKEAFDYAALILHGAKYVPEIYVNGTPVSRTEGGLAPTIHRLTHPDVLPGAEILLEICLQTLDTMEQEDASYLPVCDQWRSNLTSHLWDDVELVCYHGVRMDLLMPEYNEGTCYIRYKAYMEETALESALQIKLQLLEEDRCIGQYEGMLGKEADENINLAGNYIYGRIKPRLTENIFLWTPDSPKLYTLRVEVDGTVWEKQVGFKKFEIAKKHFKLNDLPFKIRMSTIVWHRAYRDRQFQEVAYDTEWFYEEVIRRLKRYGVNTLRFHLGNPPRRMLELCDKHGLLTQVEWSFFHDVVASEGSMAKQYEDWIGICLEHASAAIVHPWNEVDDESRHAVMIRAAERSQKYFPKYIMSHRDVIHIHAYWWSLFENLGLYYDSFEQFDKPVITDEFGGNYLDYDGAYGGYPTVRDAMHRFLGPDADQKEARIWLNTMSNGKVAEYWRRIGVAGYSPYCMISSPEDGNTHFFGSLKKPIEMPVWKALMPAYYPVAVSMDIWDRHFEPGEKVMVPLHLFNDTGMPQEVTVSIACGSDFRESFTTSIPAYTKIILEKEYMLPKQPGTCQMSAAIGEAVSVWDVCVHNLALPESLCKADKTVTVGILPQETELAVFLQECGLKVTNDWTACDVILGQHATYEALKCKKSYVDMLKAHMNRGKKAVLLTCGPMRPDSRSDDPVHNPFRGKSHAVLEELALFDGILLKFGAFPEGESHVHPDDWNHIYWRNLPKGSFELWNGLRGGLIVPAVNMEIEGVSKEAFASLWANRGADMENIKKQDSNYLAMECMGLYEFGEEEPEVIQERLMQQVNFLLADAPALRIGNSAPQVTKYNLSETYRGFTDNGNSCIPLMHAGKGFKRIPAVEVKYGSGTLILTQLITDGRLTGEDRGLDRTHKDPIVQQMVLNMLG
ncbi:MAG: hypothetical protein IKA09_07130 [Lachnospiraceae bacterium]|nr:hypothetical protein [Lachnospiraceae bacterium]